MAAKINHLIAVFAFLGISLCLIREALYQKILEYKQKTFKNLYEAALLPIQSRIVEDGRKE